VDQARASIATVYRLVFKKELSKNALVSQLVVGVHRELPTQPFYNDFYDTDVVRTYVKSLGSTSTLELMSLRDKAIILVRLATVRRGMDLTKIDLSTKRVFPDRWEFRALNTKEVLMSRGRESWSAPIVLTINPDIEICPVHTLDCYLRQAAALRPAGCRSLFLNVRPPYSPISSERLNVITTSVLRDAGVPKDFTARSTRMAETSTRILKGESFLHVYRRAGWRDPRSFMDRYAISFPRPPSSVQASVDTS
jgi:hypothetical protein